MTFIDIMRVYCLFCIGWIMQIIKVLFFKPEYVLKKKEYMYSIKKNMKKRLQHILISHLMLEYVFAGPDTWGEDFPIANGPRQSPINIVPKDAKYDSTLKPLKIKYDPSNAKGILNNGHSFQVDYVDDSDSSSKHSSWMYLISTFTCFIQLVFCFKQNEVKHWIEQVGSIKNEYEANKI